MSSPKPKPLNLELIMADLHQVQSASAPEHDANAATSSSTSAPVANILGASATSEPVGNPPFRV